MLRFSSAINQIARAHRIWSPKVSLCRTSLDTQLLAPPQCPYSMGLDYLVKDICPVKGHSPTCLTGEKSHRCHYRKCSMLNFFHRAGTRDQIKRKKRWEENEGPGRVRKKGNHLTDPDILSLFPLFLSRAPLSPLSSLPIPVPEPQRQSFLVWTLLPFKNEMDCFCFGFFFFLSFFM